MANEHDTRNELPRIVPSIDRLRLDGPDLTGGIARDAKH
jgi:hypothetical protein